MPPIAYLNGQFLPLEQARVSIDDRGFQFGDGVYEVVRVYRGKPFRLEDHLIRLERSAQAISIPMTLSVGEWERVIRDGIDRSQLEECKVYIQITRGVAPREHTFPSSSIPTTVMTVRDIDSIDAVLRQGGVSAITLPDQRWGRCSIKSLNLLPNLLAKQQAKEQEAFEAILIKEGSVTEGTSSNVMMASDDVLVTPALSDQLLAGVTRQELLTLARHAGIQVEERVVKQDELMEAQEVFLAGTTIEVIGVTKLDGKPIGNGHVGLMTRRLQSMLLNAVANEC
ncbi:MAG: D-amino-acid transaminase [Nitrospirota bacterium]|nr:D-amino-acid transaminase [Nitrospirota bacterium]